MTTNDVVIIGRAITIQRAIQKRTHEPTKRIKKGKEVNSAIFFCCKVERIVTLWEAIEKSV